MSPGAEALVAAAVRGPNQAASAAARVKAKAHAAVVAVQAESEGRRAAAAQLLLMLRLPPRHHLCSALVPLCPRLRGQHRLKCCTGKGRCLASLLG